jgi:ribosomal protein S18 acetylase RimI-like enzyme
MTDVPPIETLARGDAPELRVLSQTIGWAHTDDDWRTILQVGRVFGHRASDGGFLSSGALFEYGPSLASIGMILVTPACRGRGLARAMMRHCLAAAGSTPVTLIATEQGEPLYRALGFVEVERVCRVLVAPGVPAPRLAPITARDLEPVTRLDAEMLGGDRRTLLAALLARAEASAVASDGRGRIRGFGFAVRQAGRLAIGPVAAREADDALTILRSLAAGHDAEVRVDVPTRQTRILEALAELGARPSADAPLMLYGAATMPGRRDGIYALASRGFG